MKVKEKQVQKIIPKQIKKIENNKKIRPLEKRKNCIKKKLQISKTLSVENVSTGPKYTTRQKSSFSGKLFNNSMEEFDYLNFSDIDIDLIKKISGCEKDIFKQEIISKNQNNKNDIVQNRYNMIDTSFDTNQQDEVLNNSEDEYIEINKNILIKTPSTICNYYDMDSDKKNLKNNKIEDKKNKTLKNKNIQISNNNIINYNNQTYSNRIKPSKNFSSSNISLPLPQNNKNIYSNTNVGFYKNKISKNNINQNGKKIKTKEVITPILKDRNKEINNKINSQVKNDKNNLLKSYLDSNNKKYNNKTHSNKNKKSLSIKQYSEYITSQVIKKNKKNSNCNFTFNNDITLHLKNQQNIQDLFDSIKEIKETINNNLNKNTSNESDEKNENPKIQKPIMLCLNKPKFNSYFKTPKNSTSAKRENKPRSSMNKNKEKNLEKSNIAMNNYTGRNYQKSCETTQRNIVVKRKKKEKKNDNGCYINYCIKSINSNTNKKINNNNSTKINITFHNYINNCIDTPIIKVNLKKHLKSSSQLMQFINVNSKSSKQKSKTKTKSKNSRCLSNNKSFINTCTKRSINTSQLIKELLTKRQELKSPLKTKNNNSMLKISKTSKEKSASFINRIKNKSIKKLKEEKTITYQKQNIFGSNNKKFYSIKYEINIRNNGNTKNERNKNDNKIWNKNTKTKNKNILIPKTQSDIKVHRFKIKEEKNNENILKNENEEYGMEKRVKQKLIDRMNKVTKNTFGNIWGTKKKNCDFSEIMKSPFNKEYSITHKNFYNKKIISNENSKNDEREIKNIKSIEKRNQFEFKIIKDYNGTNTYNNIF